MNSKWHKAHGYLLFPEWHIICFFIWFQEMNPIHTEHIDMDGSQYDYWCVSSGGSWYGFSPAWFFRWFYEMNPSAQRTQWYGFYITWLFMCLFIWSLEMNPFSHRAQRYRFLPIWLFICLIGWFLEMNFLPHRVQQ